MSPNQKFLVQQNFCSGTVPVGAFNSKKQLPSLQLCLSSAKMYPALHVQTYEPKYERLTTNRFIFVTYQGDSDRSARSRRCCSGIHQSRRWNSRGIHHVPQMNPSWTQCELGFWESWRAGVHLNDKFISTKAAETLTVFSTKFLAIPNLNIVISALGSHSFHIELGEIQEDMIAFWSFNLPNASFRTRIHLRKVWRCDGSIRRLQVATTSAITWKSIAG